MSVVMVKKRLASGEPCRKCIQAEELLRSRGLWDSIDEVLWADELDPGSPGTLLAHRHQVAEAPFYVVDGDRVYTSTLLLAREVLRHRASTVVGATGESEDLDIGAAAVRLADATPKAIIRWALESFGSRTALAFSGAEDVVAVHLAAETGLPFELVTIDTGRLHPETYELIEAVRQRYGVDLVVAAPDTGELEALVNAKGLFSFYEDGHAECCEIRKVRPLGRALAGRPAWITGQRRDHGSATRSELAVVERDRVFGSAGRPLIKVNPLANWTSEQVWAFIREHQIPYNALHDRGYASIGCAPCTRAISAGESVRDGRWWWESDETRECGLHAPSSLDRRDR
jgi:phosphoadenosine phosphosulfate reductase